MKKGKNRFRLNELLLVMADAKRTYSATMKRGIMNDGSILISGKVIVEEGQIISRADSEEELADYLDTICKFKLDHGLHKVSGRQSKIFKTTFFHN
jgi:hypothetical protein